MLRPVLLVLTGVAGDRAADHVRESRRPAARPRVGAAREMAIRLSMGAGRSRVVQQLLVEGTLLAGLGAAGALLALRWTSGLLIGFAPPSELPIQLDVVVDARVLWFTAAIAIGTVLLFAFARRQAAPADVATALREASAAGRAFGTAPTPPKPRGSAGGALDCTVGRCRSVHAQPHDGNTDDARLRRRRRRGRMARPVLRRLQPGGRPRLLRPRCSIASAPCPALTRVTRPADSARLHRRQLQRRHRRGTDAARAIRWRRASTTSVPTTRRRCGCRSSRGVTCRASDVAKQPRVAVITEAMARIYWKGRDAVGGRVMFGGPRPGTEPEWITVVGVARDIKHRSLTERAQPYMFVPVLQAYSSSTVLHVRTSGSLDQTSGELPANPA